MLQPGVLYTFTVRVATSLGGGALLGLPAPCLPSDAACDDVGTHYVSARAATRRCPCRRDLAGDGGRGIYWASGRRSMPTVVLFISISGGAAAASCSWNATWRSMSARNVHHRGKLLSVDRNLTTGTQSEYPWRRSANLVIPDAICRGRRGRKRTLRQPRIRLSNSEVFFIHIPAFSHRTLFE